MVTLTRRRIVALVPGFLAIPLLLSSCSPSKWWGEKAPVLPAVEAGAATSGGSSSSCEDASRILLGSEQESSDTFECLVQKADGIWSQVQGKEKDELTDIEITTLIEKGVIPADGPQDVLLARLMAGKKLLGFGPKVTRAKVNQWIAWARKNRGEARRLYSRLSAKGAGIRYEDIRTGVRLASLLLSELTWAMDSQDLAGTLQALLQLRDPDLQKGLYPAAQAGINLLGAICPTINDKDLWRPSDLSACLNQLVMHFSPGAPWVEFALNPVSGMKPEQAKAVAQSLELMEIQFNDWFSNPRLEKLNPSRWVDLAKRMGANPPEDLIDALKVIKRFGGKSTENAIDPGDFHHFFEVLKKYHLSLLDGLPHFTQAVNQHQCEAARVTSWLDCAPLDHSLRQRSERLDLAFRVKSTRHGPRAAPMDGRQFAKIMFFNAAAGKIVEAFDVDKPGKPKDGLISAEASEETTAEVVQLIDTGMRTFFTIKTFVDRIGRKLDGLAVPAEEENTVREKWEKTWDQAGFARLITMTSDLLVKQSPRDTNAIERFFENFFNVFPQSGLVLNDVTITAVITTLDMLGGYRDAYLAHFPESALVYAPGTTTDAHIRRKALAEQLPALLRLNFPRTYESCMNFGFELSCGIAFESILAESPAGSGLIASGDLDVMTIIAASIEGIFDACDVDDDGRLEWRLLDGNDELDCGFVKTKDVVTRLIDSRIIDMKVEDKKKVKRLLELANSTFLTRPSGKTAMVRGSKSGMILNTFTFWAFGNKATIGSTYGLLSDFINDERVKEASQEKQTRRASPRPGPSPRAEFDHYR